MTITPWDEGERAQTTMFVRSLGFKLMAGVPEYRAGILAAESAGVAESFRDELYPVEVAAVLGRLQERASRNPLKQRQRLQHLRAMEATALLPYVEALLQPDIYIRRYARAWSHSISEDPAKRDLLTATDRRYGSKRLVSALGGLLWLCENVETLPVKKDAVVSAGLMIRMTDFFTHYRALMG